MAKQQTGLRVNRILFKQFQELCHREKLRPGEAVESLIREKLWNVAASYYSEKDWAHGKNHVQRVLENALRIGKIEGADLDVVEASAILHDIFVYKETHSGIEEFRHEVEAAKEARRILSELNFDEEFVEAVSHCILAHRKRRGPEPETIEAKCLFDADKLDCIGAIGVLRSAFVSFDHGQEVYRDEPDLKAYKRHNIRHDGTIIDFSLHSSNLEYELSLKHVAGKMQTETGRNLAKERAAFMTQFYNRLDQEMKGAL